MPDVLTFPSYLWYHEKAANPTVFQIFLPHKIYQPEADELLLVVKNNKETYRLLISAGASLPLIYFTTKTKANPMTAPNFCMLLRKYISNGRIIEITQPGMERIVEITILP